MAGLGRLGGAWGMGKAGWGWRSSPETQGNRLHWPGPLLTRWTTLPRRQMAGTAGQVGGRWAPVAECRVECSGAKGPHAADVPY